MVSKLNFAASAALREKISRKDAKTAKKKELRHHTFMPLSPYFISLLFVDRQFVRMLGFKG